jgi:hypothetical protein
LYADGETGVRPGFADAANIAGRAVKDSGRWEKSTADATISATIRQHFTEIALESRLQGLGTPFAEGMASSVATVGWAHC